MDSYYISYDIKGKRNMLNKLVFTTEKCVRMFT